MSTSGVMGGLTGGVTGGVCVELPAAQDAGFGAPARKPLKINPQASGAPAA